MLKIFPISKFRSAKILVVDDNVMNLKLICAKLSASGYTNIETAADGQEAIEVTSRVTPDIVLLDLMMPVLDGYGYMEHIRGDTNIIHMPIIVQTALNDRETKLRALSCGADDFLNKPLDLEEVALRVHIHLERFFILQHLDALRAQLNTELQQANLTIKQLESKLSESDRELLARHHEAIHNIAMPVGMQKDQILLSVSAIKNAGSGA